MANVLSTVPSLVTPPLRVSATSWVGLGHSHTSRTTTFHWGPLASLSRLSPAVELAPVHWKCVNCGVKSISCSGSQSHVRGTAGRLLTLSESECGRLQRQGALSGFQEYRVNYYR